MQTIDIITVGAVGRGHLASKHNSGDHRVLLYRMFYITLPLLPLIYKYII